MSKPYRIQVFGKPGCRKCSVLNQRLDKLLAAPEWQDFEKEYCDLETEEGLVAFCEAEVLNPQRVPAMRCLRRNDSGAFAPAASSTDGAEKVFGKSHLFGVAGLQTDYSGTGRGILSPKMIQAVLEEARD